MMFRKPTLGKVVVVAGGPWQKSLVLFLKKKGHYVCVVNPTRTDTVAAADHHIEADVNDFDTINRHMAEINPVFVTSDQSDISTMTVARLSEAWRLPGNKPEVVERFSNKLVMSEFGRTIGVNVPVTKLVISTDDIRAFAAENGLPVIIKPTDATNSRGFRKLESLDDLDMALASSTRFSKSGKVIVQQYIAGEEQITLDGVCSGGRHRTLATSKKGFYFKPGLTSCVRYPSHLPPDLLDRIIEQNDRYVEEAGMEFGLTHGEYIVNGNDFCMIEIAGRGAGASITSKITPWVSGIDPYDVLYESLLGRIVDVKALSTTSKPAILQFYHEDHMTYCNKRKAELIASLPGVAAFEYDFRSKQFATDMYNPRHTMGVYLADSEIQLDAIIREVDDIICRR